MATDKDIANAVKDARAEQRYQRSLAKQEKAHRQALRRQNIGKRNAIQREAAKRDIRLVEVREREQIKAQSRARQRFEKEQAKTATGPSSWETGGRAIGTGIAGTGNFIGSQELLSTTLWLMFGLIIVYLLVHNADNTSGFVSRLGDSIHKLSSTTPLFQASSTG